MKIDPEKNIIQGFKEIIIEVEKGDRGERGEKGECGPNGKDGKDYVLTKKDKLDIASKIKVPTVERIIEKVVIEQPIFNTTETIKEIENKDTPEQIVEKINSKEKVIEWKVLKNIPDIFRRNDHKEGGNGIGYIHEASDVELGNTDPTNGYALTWSSSIRKWVASPTISSVSWGSITGTLSNQTDLQTALNLKLENITGFITAGSNITITGTGTLASPYNISASAGGVTTLSAIGSSPNANGATITGTTLNLQPASATFGGVVTTGTQTFAGAKTFSTSITLPSFTLGSVIFAGTGGLLSQDNANFFWDDTNNRLGIGTAAPTSKIHILGTGTTALALIYNTDAFAGGTNFTSPHITIRGGNDVLGDTTRISLVVGGGGQTFLESTNTDATNLYSTFQVRTRGADGMVVRSQLDRLGNLKVIYNANGGVTANNIITVYNNSAGIGAGDGGTGGIAFSGSNTGGSGSEAIGGAIYSKITTNSPRDADMFFHTTRAGTSTEAMRIMSSGRVGIGTTAPATILHLAVNTAAIQPMLTLQNSDNTLTNGGVIRMLAGASAVSEIYYRRDRFDISSNVEINITNTTVGYTGFHLDASNNNMILGGATSLSDTRVVTKSSGTTSATFSLRVRNSANTDIAVFRSDSHIAFGTATPLSNRVLTIQGINAASSHFGLTITDNGGLVTFQVRNDGKVGVGDVNPLYPLHIYAPTAVVGSGGQQLFIQDGSTAGYFCVEEDASGSANYLPTFTGRSAGLDSLGLQIRGAMISGNDVLTSGRAAVVIEGARSSAVGTYSAIVNSNILKIANYGTALAIMDVTGRLGLGVTTPAAVLHIKAGTATANTAPLKFDSGTLNTTAEAGTHEYNGNHYLTNANIRFSVGGSLFDHFTDVSVGGAEADIYTNTTAANTLNVNGGKLIAEYGGNFVTGGTELTQLKVYFAGTAIWDSTGVAPTTGTTSWRVYVELIRVSATVVRYTVSLNTTGASGFVYCAVGELTGLTLSGTNILKITGTSSGVGSGVNDIVGKMGYVRFAPAS